MLSLGVESALKVLLHKAFRLTSQPRDAPQFYLTSPSACPYLPGKEERKVFTHIVGRRGRELNEILTQGGFRRSQTIAYRPACDTCRACVSVRVLVDEFEPSGNLKRILRKNGDLIGNPTANRPTSEQYSLFRRYVDTRHADGGMADMTVLDYSMMVEDSHVDTRLIEYRRRGIEDRKSTRLNSSHANISYAVFCLKKKKHNTITYSQNTIQ